MMDKIKPYLAMAKKYHFWGLCGLVVIVTMAVWSLASGEINRQFTGRRDKLKGLEEGVRKITQETDPPNDKVVQAAQVSNARLEQQVYYAWNVRYLEQKKKNPWPEELGPEFLLMINSLGPEDEIPRLYRETYMTFIKNYFPRLFEIIDLRRTVPKLRSSRTGKPGTKDATPEPAAASRMAIDIDRILGGGGTGVGSMTMGSPGMGGMGTGPVEMELVGKVEWDENDIRRMASRFMWQQAPTSLEVRVVQEDLWVYKALLEIIRTTNGAVRFKDLPIRRIEALQIARDASDAFVKAESRLLNASGMGGGMGGMPMMGAGMPGMEGAMAPPAGAMPGDAGGMPGAMGAAPGGESLAERRAKELNNFRYVDQKGKPLSADTKPPFAEFKMMPVYMRLIVNQQKIPNLLVECANSTMPVEVCRVGFRPGEAHRVSFGSGSSGMGSMGAMGMPPGMGMAPGMGMPPAMSAPGMPPGMGGMGMEYMGAGGGASFPTGPQQAQIVSAEYVPIEVFGIIYIFNPPDPTKLGTGSVGDTARGGVAPAPATGGPVAAGPAAPTGGVPAAAPGAPAAPGAAPVGPGAVPIAAPGAAPGVTPGAGPAAVPGAPGTPAAAVPVPGAIPGTPAPAPAAPAPTTPAVPGGAAPTALPAAAPGAPAAAPGAPPAAAAPTAPAGAAPIGMPPGGVPPAGTAPAGAAPTAPPATPAATAPVPGTPAAVPKPATP